MALGYLTLLVFYFLKFSEDSFRTLWVYYQAEGSVIFEIFKAFEL